MINSKKELRLYLMVDMMMNRGYFNYDIKTRIKNWVVSDPIMKYLQNLRKLEYALSRHGFISVVHQLKYKRRLMRLGLKLGFSIPCNVFGYGLVLPHYGTIVVGEGNIIGNYCVLHTSTCITSGKKKIGDGLYLSAGAKIVHNIELGENVSIGTNSLVNKTINESNCMIAGMPAQKIKISEPWYIRDGKEYQKRHERCEELVKNIKNKK